MDHNLFAVILIVINMFDSIIFFSAQALWGSDSPPRLLIERTSKSGRSRCRRGRQSRRRRQPQSLPLHRGTWRWTSGFGSTQFRLQSVSSRRTTAVRVSGCIPRRWISRSISTSHPSRISPSHPPRISTCHSRWVSRCLSATLSTSIPTSVRRQADRRWRRTPWRFRIGRSQPLW